MIKNIIVLFVVVCLSGCVSLQGIPDKQTIYGGEIIVYDGNGNKTIIKAESNRK